MAIQKPLIIVGGQIQQIPIGDTLSAGAVEVDVIVKLNANVGALVIGTPVYASSATQVDKAGAAAAGTRKVLGLMTPVSTAPATSGFVQTDGILTASTAQWDAVAGTTGGLAVGVTYFLSATAGLLTATAPSTGGQYVCEVGLGLSPTEMEIDTNRLGTLLA